jgi:hypothetical protein
MRQFLLVLAIVTAAPVQGVRGQAVPELPPEAPIPQAAPARPPVSVTPEPGDATVQSTAPNDPGSAAASGMRHGEADVVPRSPTVLSQPDADCEAALAALGVRYMRLAPIDGAGACGVAAPYRVTEIVAGVSLAPDGVLTCQAALALARWVQSIVVPSAKALGAETRLTGISQASTYMCRPRGGEDSGKLSEHAFGNAIDIAGFTFRNYESLSVAARAGEGTMAEAFQKSVRAGACLFFTTVLGPGSDEDHDDHLHLDVTARAGGYRLCR